MPKLKRSVLSADVSPETLERLKEICKLENKSQAKVLEQLIYSYRPSCNAPIIKSIVIVPKCESPFKAIKKVDVKPSNEPTLAQLLKQTYSKKQP